MINFSGVEVKTTELRNCIVENAIWNLSTFELSHISDTLFNGTMYPPDQPHLALHQKPIELRA